jgi:hypothetical protein
MNSILTPTFYNGIIYVSIIAFFMLIFELIFFKVIIEKQEDLVIQYNLSTLKSIINNPTDVNFGDGFIDTAIERETELNEIINSNLLLFMSFFILLFFIIIVMCFYATTDVWPTVCVSIITLGILLLFQITMYFYGHAYEYTTDIELKDDIMNYISISLYSK